MYAILRYIILFCNGYNCMMLYNVKCICGVNPISCICLWTKELLLFALVTELVFKSLCKYIQCINYLPERELHAVR
jgi:hypothetical protein